MCWFIPVIIAVKLWAGLHLVHEMCLFMLYTLLRLFSIRNAKEYILGETASEKDNFGHGPFPH